MSTADYEALQGMLPPPRSGGDAIDWATLRADFGLIFPSDYRKFVEIYGGGTVDDTLYIVPLAKRMDSWRQEYTNASENLLKGDAEVELRMTAIGENQPHGLLIPWGVTPTSDVGYWLAQSDSSDDWPIVVFRNRKLPTWLRYDMGFSRFLSAIISGEIDNPFGVNFPAESGRADYLNWRDEDLLAHHGVFVPGYIHNSREFFAEVAAAGFDPREFFASASRLA